MRRFGRIAAAASLGLTLAAASGATATATAAAGAAVPTLSVTALGGPPVNPGDTLSSSLTPGTQLSLTTAPGGAVGLFCNQSSWTGITLANPPVPGPATIRITAMTIAACTDNNPTVLAVSGVAVTNLPVILQVNGAGAFPIQIIPGGPPPVQIVASLTTTAGPVVCTYQAVPPTSGNTGLGALPWRFVNQRFNLVAGPLPPCGAGLDFFSASYSPVTDVTQLGANVYVN